MMIGNKIMAIVKEPNKTFVVSAPANFVNGNNTATPIKPKMMLGTPVNISIALRIPEVILFLAAYSCKYMAAPIPKGNAINKLIIMRYNVVSNEPRIPPPGVLK